jgi:hypothetical protein
VGEDRTIFEKGCMEAEETFSRKSVKEKDFIFVALTSPHSDSVLEF